jgi:NAD(P)-dependent dehydrogenase (short-subunit alcohol dehydrogenase family)
MNTHTDNTHNTPQKILITGAARGLGEDFARAAIAAGAKVVIADIEDARGAALAAALGQNAHYIHMNVADSASVNAGVAAAAAWLGGKEGQIDGLVNNAAITSSGGKFMHEIAEPTWDAVMAVNVKGTWLTTVAATRYLKASQHGRVVNVSSDTSLWGAPKLMAYIASKGAINALTHSMARELGEFGITVNAVAPGLVVGESTQYVPQARHDFYMQGRAIPREQLPADVTAAVLFLLSREASFITGQILPVNGGFFMSN